MPLRLKQLELHGYKTFATKSLFVFSEGISAIVGPNGSGKSNILDAIRWVLGEQSYGLLRGKKTEDMIFAGSELRPRAGMAQATLTFDNSDGWLPIDYSEVSIARRAYRDGENEYLLNDQRVRLRDISELLAKCGLAERTYTIIGQGLIDTALSLKAEERRALFEEAAGIGVYRNKREEALRKLEATGRNLERVLDILAEIKPRLRSLERQAQRARDFNRVKEDLHALLKLWYGYHWHRAVEAVAHSRAQAEHAAAALADIQTEQSQHDEEIARLRAQLHALRGQVGTWRQEAGRLHAASEALARELAVGAERARALDVQREAAAGEVRALEAQLADQAERARATQAEVERLRAEASEAESQLRLVQAEATEYEARRAEAQRQAAEQQSRIAELEGRLTALRARLQHLAERQDRLTQAAAEHARAASEADRALADARAPGEAVTAAWAAAQRARTAARAAVEERTAAARAQEARLTETVEEAARLRAEVERLAARQEVLAEAQAAFGSEASGGAFLRKAAIRTRGALADLIQVPPELEAAVGAALGAYGHALVVEQVEEAVAALEVLSETGGRSAFLPLDRIRVPEPLSAPADPGVLGVAARLVKADPDLAPVIELLLGRVLITAERATARRWAERWRAPAQTADRQAPPAGSGDAMDANVGGPQTAREAPAVIVTLAGEVYHTTGPVEGGREAGTAAWQRVREARELRSELDQATQRWQSAEAAREAAEASAVQARAALLSAQQALSSAEEAERRAAQARDAARLEVERLEQQARFASDKASAQQAEAEQAAEEARSAHDEWARLLSARRQAEDLSAAPDSATSRPLEQSGARLAHWQTEHAVAARAAQDAETRAAELDRGRDTLAGMLADRQSRMRQWKAEAAALSGELETQRRTHAALRLQLAQVDERLGPAEQRVAALEAEQARVEASDAQARAALQAAERANAQAQLEHARRTEELDNLRRRVEEDFGLVEFDYGEEVSGPTPLPIYPLVEKLERVDALPDGLEEQLNRKRGQLRRMGLINPEAEREHVEVHERHEFLSTQVTDLQAAQAQLRDVIAEMDVLMERDFRKTFEAVASEFRDTFARLFGGGSAKLVLTDPEHLSTTGIDIHARLPGRRTQGLALLSGGERSLTACALVFALLRVSPTPFAVLDEVDAMLDEANVGRYREMLQELSATTQFVIITHNRNTVQVADTVYGITMGADSASQVIGLKLDGEQVKAPAEAAVAP